MDAVSTRASRGWALAGAVILAAAAALAGADAFRGAVRAWIGLGAGAVGAGLLAGVCLGRGARPWVLVAAGVAVVYLVLGPAPKAGAAIFYSVLSAPPEGVGFEAMPVVRFVLALAALGVYMRLAAPLGPMWRYALCCAVLGVLAVFFLLWQPPPPKPVPIARPLIGLKDDLLAALAEKERAGTWPSDLAAGWTAEHEVLPESVEKQLGADQYVNLRWTSPESRYEVQVFVTYNANAWSNIPHVPWVCMTQAGYRVAVKRTDPLPHPGRQGREIEPTVLLFEPGRGMPPEGALMFQYFNVGGTYATGRSRARILATTGAVGRRGSYLSQTQISVYLSMAEAEHALEPTSKPYRLCRHFLEAVVPLLEQNYYPDLTGPEGGS